MDEQDSLLLGAWCIIANAVISGELKEDLKWLETAERWSERVFDLLKEKTND